MNRAPGTALAALMLLAATLSGCGGGGDTTGSEAATHTRTSAVGKPKAPLSPAAAKAAEEIGRKACQGLTPLQAAQRYEGPARHAGATKDFAAFVASPPPSTLDSPGFPRLVAALYATTLPANQRADAAAGCAAELATQSSGG